LRPLTKGKLIAVFGSAGERDRAKRPALAEVAAKHADLFVITQEDPRLEEPAKILDEIEAGAIGAGKRRGTDYLVIDDRPEAGCRRGHTAGRRWSSSWASPAWGSRTVHDSSASGSARRMSRATSCGRSCSSPLRTPTSRIVRSFPRCRLWWTSSSLRAIAWWW